MVLAYHMILSAYGFWLPNDPRGSWSTEVWAKDLKPFGDPIDPGTRRSVANRTHDRASRLEAKKHLVLPPVRFNGVQANAIVNGIASTRKSSPPRNSNSCPCVKTRSGNTPSGSPVPGTE